MTHKLPLREHLRNGALYRSPAETSPGEEWKRRLIYQHSMHRQLKAALRERNRLFKRFMYISMPVACIALVFAAYFGFIHPEQWFESILPVLNFNVPPIGLKEILIFAAIVNGLTFSIRKRVFAP